MTSGSIGRGKAESSRLVSALLFCEAILGGRGLATGGGMALRELVGRGVSDSLTGASGSGGSGSSTVSSVSTGDSEGVESSPGSLVPRILRAVKARAAVRGGEKRSHSPVLKGKTK